MTNAYQDNTTELLYDFATGMDETAFDELYGPAVDLDGAVQYLQGLGHRFEERMDDGQLRTFLADPLDALD